MSFLLGNIYAKLYRQPADLITFNLGMGVEYNHDVSEKAALIFQLPYRIGNYQRNSGRGSTNVIPSQNITLFVGLGYKFSK